MNELDKNKDLEIQLLLEAIEKKYGYDFRDYSLVHVRRRVDAILRDYKYESVLQLVHDVIYKPNFFFELIKYFSVNVTEMFRDPNFYKAVREEVIPVLKTYPFIKMWHAGCATGEEVYSMAILLKEEGLYDRTQIYATDFNALVVKKAEEGIYPLEKIKEYTENYHRAGGKKPFSDYFQSKYNAVKLNSDLKKNIVFATHNLATDSGFGEMHVIFCRNVLIYFNIELQNKVLNLFNDSLIYKGFFCLGNKETLQFSSQEEYYTKFNEKQRIYRKEK